MPPMGRPLCKILPYVKPVLQLLSTNRRSFYAFLKIFQKTVETTGNNLLIDILLNKYGPYRDGGI